MFKVKCVSLCGTYRETMKCLTLAEAEALVVDIQSEGEFTATIVAPK